MTAAQQQKAAKEFAAYWQGKGYAPVQPVRAHFLRTGCSQHPVQRPLPQSQPEGRQAPVRRPGQGQGLLAGLRSGVHVLV